MGLVVQSIKVARLTRDKTKSETVFFDFLKTTKNDLRKYRVSVTIYFVAFLLGQKKNRCVSGSPTDPSSNPPTLTFFFTFPKKKIVKESDKKYKKTHSHNVLLNLSSKTAFLVS